MNQIPRLVLIISFTLSTRTIAQKQITTSPINLNYSIFGKTLSIEIVKENEKHIEKFEIDREQLRKNIFGARKLLNRTTGKEKLIETLGALYDMLFLEIEKYLPEGKIISFNGDDYLSDVPFHLLFHEGEFLLERYYVFYANDFFPIIGFDKKEPLSYNDLKSDESEEYSDNYGNKIKEALKIGVIPTISERSSVGNFKRALGICRTIYLTTHGTFETTYKGSYILKFGDQLIESSEIEHFNNGCDFIFINACNSASSSTLLNSMSAIGMKTVIGSMWENPSTDRATANVVKRFYKNWKSGMSKIEALISAQRKTLKKEWEANSDQSDSYRKGGDHPHYWGAFVLIGDYR